MFILKFCDRTQDIIIFIHSPYSADLDIENNNF